MSDEKCGGGFHKGPFRDNVYFRSDGTSSSPGWSCYACGAPIGHKELYVAAAMGLYKCNVEIERRERGEGIMNASEKEEVLWVKSEFVYIAEEPRRVRLPLEAVIAALQEKGHTVTPKDDGVKPI